MTIHLITIGQKMPAWIQAGYQVYTKRLQPPYQLKLITLRLNRSHRKKNKNDIMQEEGKHLWKNIPAHSHIVALDAKGDMWNSNELAKQLMTWQEKATPISLIVGGVNGLDQQYLIKAHQHWSLSRLTFPHLLVRVIVAEQIYRAYSLIRQHPYHK